MNDLKVRALIVSSNQRMNWEKVSLIARGLHNHFAKYYEDINFIVSSGDQNGCEIFSDLPESIIKDVSHTAKRLAREYAGTLETFLVIKK